MKTFIFILILVIGFFIYLFMNSNTTTVKEPINLENIAQQNSATIETQTKEDITQSDTDEPVAIAIPEDQTFDTIKNILKKASGSKYSPEVTLNSRINSYLYTTDAKEQFKQDIASSFNLTYDEVDKQFKKNRLVWDWVNQLRE